MSAPAVVDPHEASWYAERRTYIGASEAAVIVGVSPWQTEYQLWLEKRGELVRDGQSAVQTWGHRVEQVAADIYAETTGRRLRRYDPQKVKRHRVHPFVGCNPDRGVLGRGEKRGVQIKSSWKAMTEVPDHYRLQVQQEMAVMGWDVVDLAVLTGFGGFEIHEVPRDDEQIRYLLDIESGWWQRHMVEGIEPPRTGRYLNALWHEDTMRASETQADAVRTLIDLRARMKRLEATESNAVEWIKRSMAGASKLDGRDYGVTATWVKPWSKDVPETDWHAAFDEVAETYLGEHSRVEVIANHTTTRTKTGGGGLLVKSKDAEPAPEEEEES